MRATAWGQLRSLAVAQRCCKRPLTWELRGLRGPHPRSSAGSWKACHVAAWVGQRPFVWFEDDADAVARLAGQPGLGRHLTVRVE